MTATNAMGTGPASAASAPAVPAGPPLAPTSVKATTGQNASSTVSWTTPSDDGGSAITGYQVTSSPGGQTCTSTGATSCTVSGLTNGTSYTFTVTATNSAGTSAASAPSNAVVPASTPGAPTGVSATSYANDQSTVTWSGPSNTGGTPITSYTVTSSGGQTCTTANGSTTSCTFLGLVNGTTYTFTVAATNSIGTGPPSAPATGTPSTVPNAPTSVTAADVPGIPYVQSPEMSVSWTAPAWNGGAPITGYTA